VPARRWESSRPRDVDSIIPADAPKPAGGKKTCAQRYAGFALDGNDWDGIHAGDRKPMDLVYAGEVGHGFDRARRADQPKGVIRHLVVRLDGGLHCR